MNNGHYSPSTDNVASNACYQGIDFSKDIADQEKTLYPAVDNLQNATINDNYIYLSTTDRQHACYEAGAMATQDDHTSFSGYFTNENTALNRVSSDGTFDAFGKGAHRGSNGYCFGRKNNGSSTGEHTISIACNNRRRNESNSLESKSLHRNGKD